LQESNQLFAKQLSLPWRYM